MELKTRSGRQNGIE